MPESRYACLKRRLPGGVGKARLQEMGLRRRLRAGYGAYLVAKDFGGGSEFSMRSHCLSPGLGFATCYASPESVRWNPERREYPRPTCDFFRADGRCCSCSCAAAGARLCFDSRVILVDPRPKPLRGKATQAFDLRDSRRETRVFFHPLLKWDIRVNHSDNLRDFYRHRPLHAEFGAGSKSQNQRRSRLCSTFFFT